MIRKLLFKSSISNFLLECLGLTSFSEIFKICLVESLLKLTCISFQADVFSVSLVYKYIVIKCTRDWESLVNFNSACKSSYRAIGGLLKYKVWMLLLLRRTKDELVCLLCLICRQVRSVKCCRVQNSDFYFAQIRLWSVWENTVVPGTCWFKDFVSRISNLENDLAPI